MSMRLPKDRALQAWFDTAVHAYEIPGSAEAGSAPVRLDRFLPAYPHTAVPKDTVYPWLTYEAAFSAFEDGEVSIAVNLWFYTTSEAIPNAAALELSENVGKSRLIPCQGGFIWLKRDNPFSQNLRDDADPNIKRRYIRILAEYLTAN